MTSACSLTHGELVHPYLAPVPQFLLDHIDEPVAFGTDPNGFITITGPLEGAELREIKKKAAAAELESSKGGLFDHLMRIAGKASHAAPASNMVATTPLMSNNKSTSTSSISGSVNALAAPAVATIKASTSSTVGTAAELRLSCPSGCDAEAYAHDKAAFLARWGKEYGYGGQIETLYPKEVIYWIMRDI